MKIERIIEHLGGQVRIATALGITKQAVGQWRLIPPEHVLVLSEVSTLSPHDMRPDLYPHPSDGMHDIRARRKARQDSSSA